MATYSPLIYIMVGAAQKAGRKLVRDFGEVENLQVSKKGPADFVSNADKTAEKILFEELSKSRPKYSFLMEEKGEIKGSDTSNKWIIDPLDGTTNFLHGLPHFAISIGLERDGQIEAGVIYSPVNDELFYAERGKGAFLGRRRLRVSGRREPAESLFATGIPFKGSERTTRPSWPNWKRSCRFRPGCAVSAPPRWTWRTWPPAATKAIGKPDCSPGIWRRA